MQTLTRLRCRAVAARTSACVSTARRACASTSSSPSPSSQSRVLCSVAELRALRGQALKFALHPTPSASTSATSTPTTATQETTTTPVALRRARQQALATGFVFLCDETAEPRAFVNSCPHARLELDLDDSDFFSDGFLQCKAHGAFFDPQTGMCLQGPTGARAGQSTAVPGLVPLDVQIDANNNVVLRLDSVAAATARRPRACATATATNCDPNDPRAYREVKQQQLAVALANRTLDVHAMETALAAKAAARMRKYREDQQQQRQRPQPPSP